MPRSRNLGPGAPRPGNVDLNRKVIRKRGVLERGGRILESRDPGARGRGCPDPGIWAWRRPGPEMVRSQYAINKKRSIPGGPAESRNLDLEAPRPGKWYVHKEQSIGKD